MLDAYADGLPPPRFIHHTLLFHSLYFILYTSYFVQVFFRLLALLLKAARTDGSPPALEAHTDARKIARDAVAHHLLALDPPRPEV